MTLVDDYDYVIWSHADFTLSNYSFVTIMIDQFNASNVVFGSLNHTHMENPRRREEGIVPHVHCDFFIMRTDFYKRVFPQHENCDGYNESGKINDCIEVALGKWVFSKKQPNENIAVMGCSIGEDEIFRGIAGTVSGCRSNNFNNHLQFLSETNKDYYDIIMKSGIIEKKVNDDRSNLTLQENPNGKSHGLLIGCSEDDKKILDTLHLLPKPVRKQRI